MGSRICPSLTTVYAAKIGFVHASRSSLMCSNKGEVASGTRSRHVVHVQFGFFYCSVCGQENSCGCD